jgi:hypothetical protein
MKKCSNCSRPALFSLVAIISTLGITKRLQQSSPAVLFCDACLHELWNCVIVCVQTRSPTVLTTRIHR